MAIITTATTILWAASNVLLLAALVIANKRISKDLRDDD